MRADLRGAGGFAIVSYDTLDSTNEEMKRLALAGKAGHGTVVQATAQSAGRGRRGRTWVSEPGNLYCSFFLKPERSLAESAQLSFVTAVSVAAALEEVLGCAENVTCKWPNDVLIDGCKVAGILLETVGVGNTGVCEGVIVGLGVNIVQYPDTAAYPATCLAEHGGGTLSAAAVLDAVCRAFAGRYDSWRTDGFSGVRAAWLEKASGLGAGIEVRLGTETLSGIFEGLDEGGALTLLMDNGNRRQITAGDVYFTDTALQQAS